MTTGTLDRPTRTMDYAERRSTSGWRTGGWGPVLSGAAAAFLTFITFSALWLAIAAGTGNGWISGNLEWFELFTALGAAPVGGFVTGWLQPDGRRSAMFRGFASWGLVLVVGLVVGVPAVTGLFTGATNAAMQTVLQGGQVGQTLGGVSSELWAAFVIFGVGGILAAMTGAAGSAATSRRDGATEMHREETVRERATAEPTR